MRRFLLTLLAIVLVAGVLAGAGFVGYRLGYRQGAQVSVNGAVTVVPRLGRGDDFGWQRMPMPRFQDRMGPGMRMWIRPGGFEMMPGLRGGFGIFRLLGLLVQLAIVGFIIWLAYKLLTGWRLSLTPRTAPEATRVERVQTVETETKTDETTE